MLKSWPPAAQNGTFHGHRTVADIVCSVKKAPGCSRSSMLPCACDREDRLQHTESSMQPCPCDREDTPARRGKPSTWLRGGREALCLWAEGCWQRGGWESGRVSPSKPCGCLQPRSPNPACETAGIRCFKPIRLESFVLVAPGASHSWTLSTGSVSAGGSREATHRGWALKDSGRVGQHVRGQEVDATWHHQPHVAPRRQNTEAAVHRGEHRLEGPGLLGRAPARGASSTIQAFHPPTGSLKRASIPLLYRLHVCKMYRNSALGPHEAVLPWSMHRVPP